jgi:Family of unknown function (DUF6318)
MRRIAGGLVLVMLVGLTGCTSDEPDPSPTTTAPVATATAGATTTPSPTPSPTPTPAAAPTSGPDQDVTIEPTKPAALDGPPTEDNAIAVGKYFMALIPYVVATGDIAAWDALSGKDCKYCANIRTAAIDVQKAGQTVEGGAMDLGLGTAIESDDPSDGVTLLVGIDFTEHPSRWLGPDGAVVKEYPDTARAHASLELVWAQGQWTVEGASADEV